MSEPSDLVLRPLAAQSFAPFGDVVTSTGGEGRSINAGTSLRVELPEPDVLGADGRPSLSVFRAQAVQLPFVVRELERHRLGSQTFLPLGSTPFVVVVALGDDSPDVATLAAFRVDGGCGVTFRRGVWHHPLLALADGDVVVIERRGEEVDCEVASLRSFARLSGEQGEAPSTASDQPPFARQRW